MDAIKAPSRVLFVLLLLIYGSIQKSDPASPTYRAGVVEFRPIEYTNNSAKTLDENSEIIISYIEQAAEREVDIVVFPEMALPSLTLGQRKDLVARSTLVPHPSQNYAPCNNSRIPIQEALKKIACAVEKNGIYVVINLLEQEVCSGTECPSDGLFVYISNVVFDRNGRIIARSRKVQLFDEHLLNALKKPEPSIFRTDFGVTFGCLVCVDLIYEKLWPEFISLNITDIVLTSGWFSMMPFLTTIQVQAGVAYARDVNLLSAGYNHIEWGYSGSGIYAGRHGVVTAILPMRDDNEILVAEVRKKNIPTTQMDQHGVKLSNADQKEHVHNQLRENYDTDRFNWPDVPSEVFGLESELISENNFTEARLSHGEIDCKFRVNFTQLDQPQGRTHRLVAFDGIFSVDHLHIVVGVRLCAIVLYANDSIALGRDALTSSGTFNSIEIEAVYRHNPRIFMIPNTLGTNMVPLTNWTWDQHQWEDNIHMLMSLTNPAENLITFGIFGRNYERDGRLPTSD